jgi:AAA+ superfamily predicted ATPase
VNFFANSHQHLLAELARLDLRVRVAVGRARRLHGDQAELRPFFIPEAEVDHLLEKPLGAPPWTAIALPPDFQADLQRQLASLASGIAAQAAESRRRGVELRLETLQARLGLDAFDVDALLVCLAPELDLGYTRLYAYLQDDANYKHPTVELTLNLLCPQPADRLVHQARFGPTAPLRAHRLLHCLPAAGFHQTPLLAQALKLDERIRRYLLEDDTPDEQLLPFVSVLTPQRALDDLQLPAEMKQRLTALAAQDQSTAVFYFQGPRGVGKQATAESLARQRNQRLLVVHGARLAQAPPADFARLAQLIEREARLQDALLYWQDFDALLAPAHAAALDALLHVLANRPQLSLLAAEAAWQPGLDALARPFFHVNFPLPTAAVRAQLWRQALNGRSAQLDLDGVAAQFRLSGGQIRDAAATAQQLARWRNPDGGQIETADLFQASRLHSSQKLSALAQQIRPHYRWADIILPAAQLAQLRRLCDQVKHQAQVFEAWGFARKLALGRGVNALFTGQPGTGKTMAADILAGELELDLYKIDLSAVVSKYIGETEKNLARIFAEAETSNAVLFFDEADALFGKRTEVKDAHDRYANLEISYLLQRMDEYEGVVILATNLRENLDDAFVRRIRFIVEFPLPAAADRLRIWQAIWPAEAPLAADVDLHALAEYLDAPGGVIRNMALAAAFLAAAEKTTISMAHLLQASAEEYRKMGRLLPHAARALAAQPAA